MERPLALQPYDYPTCGNLNDLNFYLPIKAILTGKHKLHNANEFYETGAPPTKGVRLCYETATTTFPVKVRVLRCLSLSGRRNWLFAIMGHNEIRVRYHFNQ